MGIYHILYLVFYSLNTFFKSLPFYYSILFLCFGFTILLMSYWRFDIFFFLFTDVVKIF